MPSRRHDILTLIDELTRSLEGNLVDPVARKVRYTLAVLHAAVESLDDLERAWVASAPAGAPVPRA